MEAMGAVMHCTEFCVAVVRRWLSASACEASCASGPGDPGGGCAKKMLTNARSSTMAGGGGNETGMNDGRLGKIRG